MLKEKSQSLKKNCHVIHLYKISRVIKFTQTERRIVGYQGLGNPLQYSCLENPMDRGASWATVHGVAKTWLSDFTFTFHFHTLEKEMATHSSVLAWRIPGAGEPGGLLSMGSHRAGHNWSDLAAAAGPGGEKEWRAAVSYVQKFNFSRWRSSGYLWSNVSVLNTTKLHTSKRVTWYTSCYVFLATIKNSKHTLSPFL